MGYTHGKLLLLFVIALFVPQTGAAAVKPGQVFGDWLVECQKGQGGTGRCNLVQSHSRKGAKSPVMVVRVFRAPGVRLQIVVPLGVNLVRNVVVQVDDDKRQYTMNFNACLHNGCYAEVAIPDVLQRKMMRGNRLYARVVDNKGEPLTIAVSLKGISKGMAALARR